jgi:tetratricopeptide (TPR) repeat protein
MAKVGAEERPSDPDSRYLVGTSRRAAHSRWIAGLVVIGGMALLGIALGRRLLIRSPLPEAQAPSASSVGGRLGDLVRAGERLLQQGDLDGARENLAQARALGAQDARVLGAIAQLENANAGLAWLRLCLVDPADHDLGELSHRRLEAAVERARTAVDAAGQAAPGDPAVVRAQVDWLRLKGDLTKARDLIGPLAAKPSDPANAYALGALDLAEPAPIWASVLDRLRNAARADQGLGLARATLIYALVRAGQFEEARTELAQLATGPRAHPLLGDLRAFLRRVGEPDAGEADVGATADAEAVSSLGKTAAGDHPAAMDYREQLTRARDALSRGHLAEADELYRAVVARDPSNTEALTGLADVARARNDPRSTELYDQALAKNPSYLPALMARADLKWSSGDRSGAITLYRQVIEQAGSGSEYGQRAAARLAQTSAGTAPAPSGAKAAPAASAPHSTTPPPEIDTSDLSGLK